MRIEPLGESAYILRDLDVEPYVYAHSLALSSVFGLQEVVPSIDTVGLFVDPKHFDPNSLEAVQIHLTPQVRTHIVPILFDGADFIEVCRIVQKSDEEAIQLFTEAEYRVQCLGFLPGFPYMSGLPEEFAKLPRRSKPRIEVPIGAVAIAAGQTGIYPSASPGGWNLIGKTPLIIADLETVFFPISPGDLVHFRPIDEAEFRNLNGTRLAK
jgi:inhibitor of KinA